MFHPEITSGAGRAMTTAWLLSLRDQKPDVSGLYLLAGLLAEEEGRVSALFTELGIDRDSFLHQIGFSAKILSESLAQSNHENQEKMLADANAVRWLYAARPIALEATGEATISSEHLLLHVVEEDAVVAQWISQALSDPDLLRKRIMGEATMPIPMDAHWSITTTQEEQNALRIIDVNTNRAREALRILEEYTRFHLEDSFLTEQLKVCRHQLSHAVETHFTEEGLNRARDTQGDVGTRISTPQESIRQSISDIALANAKRLQESLRVLEEYSKVQHPGLAKLIESIRYRTYTLEKSILIRFTTRERLQHCRLYLLVSRGGCNAGIEWIISEAIAGGVDVVQLREKNLDDKEHLELATRVRKVTRAGDCLFIMNDRPDLAVLSDADGVHLGQEDMAVHQARKIVGTKMLIGVSTHNQEQLQQAMLDGADYLGIGPIFSSRTKEFETLAGLDFVKQAAFMTSLPAFAIGGIGPENVDQVIQAGSRRVAVSSAICQAEEPRQVAATMRTIFSEPLK